MVTNLRVLVQSYIKTALLRIGRWKTCAGEEKVYE